MQDAQSLQRERDDARAVTHSVETKYKNLKHECQQWLQDLAGFQGKFEVLSLCVGTPHAPTAVSYHEQSHYCRSMIGHSLGRMDIS